MLSGDSIGSGIRDVGKGVPKHLRPIDEGGRSALSFPKQSRLFDPEEVAGKD